MNQIENVRLIPTANIYEGGKCVSHTFYTADSQKKTAGVMFPATFHFGTDAPETMELLAGVCRVRLNGESNWKEYKGGESFVVPGKSGFDIEVKETMHYICHFG